MTNSLFRNIISLPVGEMDSEKELSLPSESGSLVIREYERGNGLLSEKTLTIKTRLHV